MGGRARLAAPMQTFPARAAIAVHRAPHGSGDADLVEEAQPWAARLGAVGWLVGEDRHGNEISKDERSHDLDPRTGPQM
jgi:hypothetical protein